MGFDPIMLAMSNDYTDSQRLARITREQTIILPESEVVCNGGVSGFNCEPIKPGEQYTVYVDGQKFTAKAKEIVIREDQYDEGTTVVYLGNSQPLDGVDSGENFGMIYFHEHEGAEFYYLPEVETEDTVTHSVKITGTAEVIHPIDPKFLPGVCLPVVEIADIAAITVEECAKLTACIGIPTVISAMNSKIVCTYAFADGAHIFTGYMMGGLIMSPDGTNWEYAEE